MIMKCQKRIILNIKGMQFAVENIQCTLYLIAPLFNNNISTRFVEINSIEINLLPWKLHCDKLSAKLSS